MHQMLVLMGIKPAHGLTSGQDIRDRFVWVFGWGLTRDEDAFQIVAALEEVKGWQQLADKTKGVIGYLYTTWERKYALVGAFGNLLWRGRR